VFRTQLFWEIPSPVGRLLKGGAKMDKERMLLNSKEVAQILDCSPDDVVVLAHRGKLKASKIGRYWRYRRTDVSAYKRKMNKAE
jgi:excisionase family DNA binding protein